MIVFHHGHKLLHWSEPELPSVLTDLVGRGEHIPAIKNSITALFTLQNAPSALVSLSTFDRVIKSLGSFLSSSMATEDLETTLIVAAMVTQLSVSLISSVLNNEMLRSLDESRLPMDKSTSCDPTHVPPLQYVQPGHRSSPKAGDPWGT